MGARPPWTCAMHYNGAEGRLLLCLERRSVQHPNKLDRLRLRDRLGRGVVIHLSNEHAARRGGHGLGAMAAARGTDEAGRVSAQATRADAEAVRVPAGASEGNIR